MRRVVVAVVVVGALSGCFWRKPKPELVYEPVEVRTSTAFDPPAPTTTTLVPPPPAPLAPGTPPKSRGWERAKPWN